MSLRSPLPGLLLLAGVGALTITVHVVLSVGSMGQELPWVAGIASFVAAGALVWRRSPEHPLAWWFAVTAGLVGIVQALDGITLRLGTTGGDALLPWVLLGYQLLTVVAVAAIAHLLGLFPDGQVQRSYERRVLRALWWLVALPPIVFAGRPTLLTPAYHRLGELPNPYHVPALTPVGEIAGAGVSLTQGVVAVGVVLLVLRYRRATEEPRRRIRWLLLPGLLVAGVAVIDLLAWRVYPAGPPSAVAELALTWLWIPALVSLPVAIAIALLRPRLLDVDIVLRKSLVYGFLWAVIAGVYVGAAAGLGLAAGRRLPLGLAIGIAVGATVIFQPARQRLERLADRWVFGTRTDPARLISRLGAALEETIELESLLPRMADTLQEGLGLRWARVRLEPAAPVGNEEPGEGEPVLSVPIVLGDERLGMVECGPKSSGPFTPDDEAVVGTLARQAALAVRNVRLTAELERSRARLVRAQHAERRRIERNIHDGVQQDLVALTGHAAHVRSMLERDAVSGAEALDELQAGLRRIIGELRELAHGIHPSLLSDRGLLEAVEALAARSQVPVSVRADPSLRDWRFAQEIEGAGYFTIAEALANVGKHAAATHVDVSLARSNGSLRISVSDDGTGFDPTAAGGEGLINLAERLAALGGHLDVTSRPGGGTTLTASVRVTDA